MTINIVMVMVVMMQALAVVIQTCMGFLCKVCSLDTEPLATLLLQEVEDTLVEFLERGATLETDVLNNLKAALPGDVVRQLDELIPPPPNQQLEVVEVLPEEPTVIYTADAVLENQIGKLEVPRQGE
jgi:hypothetical protein